MVAYADRQRQLEAGFRKRDFIPERRIHFSGYRELIWHKRPLYEEIRRGGFSTPFRELLCDNLIFASPLKKTQMCSCPSTSIYHVCVLNTCLEPDFYLHFPPGDRTACLNTNTLPGNDCYAIEMAF